ncbi:MAG: hypothetical protein HY706_14465 [Candidatus Hydrogenedentes bacterium]|nr:hypothetical protein [Candidatus Hydrogenedentota bacterium]
MALLRGATAVVLFSLVAIPGRADPSTLDPIQALADLTGATTSITEGTLTDVVGGDPSDLFEKHREAERVPFPVARR